MAIQVERFNVLLCFNAPIGSFHVVSLRSGIFKGKSPWMVSAKAKAFFCSDGCIALDLCFKARFSHFLVHSLYGCCHDVA